MRELSVSLGIGAGAAEESKERRKAYCPFSAIRGGMNDPYECTATMLIEAVLCFLDATGASSDHWQRGRAHCASGAPVWHLAGLGVLERLQARGAASPSWRAGRRATWHLASY